MAIVVPNLEREEKFILSLNKESYESFHEDFEKVELKQTVHIAQGNPDRLPRIGYPVILTNVLLVSQLRESAKAKEFMDRSEKKKRPKDDKEAKADREEVGASYATIHKETSVKMMNSRIPTGSGTCGRWIEKL